MKTSQLKQLIKEVIKEEHIRYETRDRAMAREFAQDWVNNHITNNGKSSEDMVSEYDVIDGCEAGFIAGWKASQEDII